MAPRIDERTVKDLPDTIKIDRDEKEKTSKVGKFNEDEENLIPTFLKSEEGKEALKKIAENIKRDFDDEWEAQRRYREKRALAWKMFAGDLPPKPEAFKDMANLHIPMMLENMSRLTCRAHSELFGDEQTIFGVKPVGPEDEEQATILSIHGNWQITEKIPDFFRQMDRALQFYFFDEVFVHSYYDEQRKENRHEVLTPDETLIPYSFTSTMPDLSDCPWRIRIRHYYKHQLKRIGKKWSNLDKVFDHKPEWDSEIDEPLAEAAAEVNEKERPDSARVAPYRILQYEGWTDELPGQDGDERFIQAYLDHASGELLSLKIYEETPWHEQLRVQKQTSELDLYRQQMDEYKLLEEQTATAPTDAIMPGMEMPVTPLPEPPIPPVWMKDPEDLLEMPAPPRKDPIHLFVHGVCIEMPSGSAGLGFGTIESDLNRAANILLSQYVDTATASNIRTFIHAGLELDKEMRIGPLRLIKVSSGATGADLKDKMIPVEVGQANPQMVDLVKFITELAQSSIQSPNVLSGEPGKSGETFRGIATRVEQATKQLSVYTRKFARDVLTYILKNNAKLNVLFMDDEEILSVSHYRGGAPITINRSLYQRDYKVTIHADLKYTSDAVRIQEADEMLKMAISVPQLATDLPLVYAAVKKCMEVRGRQDMIPLLGPAPSAPTTTFGAPPPPVAPPPGAAPGAPPGGVPARPPVPNPGGGGPNQPGIPGPKPPMVQ